MNATDEYLEACVQDAKDILNESHDGDARFLAFRLLELVAIHKETLSEVVQVVEYTDELTLHAGSEIKRRMQSGSA